MGNAQNEFTMKKVLPGVFVTLLFAIVLSTNLKAQLMPGQIAPNFTVTDENGVSHTLYDYLDDGYTVIMNMSATWCGPCWSFHQSGALDDVWENHGPAGLPGVSDETTDDMMVFWFEADVSTGTSDLYGNTSDTWGDWVADHQFVISDLQNTSIQSNYALPAFPTAWMICPNRVVQETYVGYSAGSMNANAFHNLAGDCEFATEENDPAILLYSGETTSCEALEMEIVFQNMGLTTLTSATIEAFVDGEPVIEPYLWEGSLETYQTENVILGTLDLVETAEVSFEITSGDDNASNNVLEATLSPAPEAGTEVEVIIETDNFGAEVYWRIIDEGGSLIDQGGNQGVGTNGGVGSFPPPSGEGAYGNNSTYTQLVSIPAGVECYTFEIYDYFGDGICCDYGQGSFSVVDVATEEVLFSGGDFNAEDMRKFKGGVLDVNEASSVSKFNLFPNPSNGILNVEFSLTQSQRVTIDIFDVVGKLIDSRDFGILPAGYSLQALDLSGNPQGVYLMNMSVNDGQVVSKFFLND